MPYSTYKPSVTNSQTSKVQRVNACPECGDLRCLCRPRFFAGQLLTEDDLNRLDRYIIEKNKLHNRYFHGWGVAAGLEVVCHHCKGRVLVKAGYALSPCGEDIVVCKDEVVNVCDLIKKCREKTRRESDCDTPYGAASTDCEDGTEPWVLAIRYEEKPSRGITPLRGSTEAPCCSRCCCGGSSDCGCSCHEENNNGKKKSAVQKSCKQAPAQCEPTMTCEGYRFEVYKAPPSDPSSQDKGRMFERLLACAAPLIEGLPQFDGTNKSKLTQEQVNTLCVELKETLLEYFQGHQKQYCEILECLSKRGCVERDSDLAVLIQIWLIALYHCACSAFLPPCPEPVNDPRIILATFNVNADGCTISNVCNWTTLRKFVTTFPNLQYWLSFIPVTKNLRHGLETICCESSLMLNKLCGMTEKKTVVSNIPKYKASFKRAAQSKVFGSVIMNAMTGTLSTAAPEDLFMGKLGVTADDGKPYLNAVERENLPQQLMFTQLLLPVLKDMLPDNLAAMFSLFRDASMKSAKTVEGVTAAEIITIKEQQAATKAIIEQQQDMINELKRKLRL